MVKERASRSGKSSDARPEARRRQIRGLNMKNSAEDLTTIRHRAIGGGLLLAASLFTLQVRANELKLMAANPAIQKEQARIVAAEAKAPSNPLREAYFGETHVHTAYSLDAYLGGARLTPDTAYRFAQGEKMTVNGRVHRIVEPLDFAAVTDHAEYLGEMYSTMVNGAPGHDQDKLKELRSMTSIEDRETWFLNYVVKSNRSRRSSRVPRPRRAPGSSSSRPPSGTIIRASSRRSRRSNGAQRPRAAICIATCSFGTSAFPRFP